MIRHILGAAIMLASVSASAVSVDCGAIPDRIAKVAFDGRGKSEDLTVTWPKTFKDNELIEISVRYAGVLLPLDLWPGDKNQVEAHLEVTKGQEQFELHASYRAGACQRVNITTIESWAKRH